MGTMIKRGEALRAVVRLKGETKTKTFERTKEGTALARRWIIEQEAAIVAGGATKTGFTIADILERMRLKELDKPYFSQTASLFATLAQEFGPVDLGKLTAEWWVEKAKGWDKVSPSSRLTKLTRVFGALKRASILWGCPVRWDEIKRAKAILGEMGLTGDGKARDRRVSDEEIARIKAQVGVAVATAVPLADIIDFAVLTGMRRAEILRITWDDLNTIKGSPMQWIRDRKAPKDKIGNDQNIPLLGGADKIIKRQPRTASPFIFPFGIHAITINFRRCAAAAGVKNIHFHDLRHEAISRLFEAGYTIPEVCNVSGHKSWECLKIYTNLNGADMHNGPLAQQALLRAQLRAA
jgi:integrase